MGTREYRTAAEANTSVPPATSMWINLLTLPQLKCDLAPTEARVAQLQSACQSNRFGQAGEDFLRKQESPTLALSGQKVLGNPKPDTYEKRDDSIDCRFNPFANPESYDRTNTD